MFHRCCVKLLVVPKSAAQSATAAHRFSYCWKRSYTAAAANQYQYRFYHWIPPWKVVISQQQQQQLPVVTASRFTLCHSHTYLTHQVRGAHGSSSGSISSSSSEPPVNGNGQRRNSFLWVKVPIDDQKKTVTSIVVEEGDSIDTIKERIKNKNSNIFASIDAPQMKLFESEQDIEQEKSPLDARMKWNSTVSWGTENTPLFVQVPVNRNSESPRSHTNGEC
jgi:Crinkler effector protein N-terminal domain